MKEREWPAKDSLRPRVACDARRCASRCSRPCPCAQAARINYTPGRLRRVQRQHRPDREPIRTRKPRSAARSTSTSTRSAGTRRCSHAAAWSTCTTPATSTTTTPRTSLAAQFAWDTWRGPPEVHRRGLRQLRAHRRARVQFAGQPAAGQRLRHRRGPEHPARLGHPRRSRRALQQLLRRGKTNDFNGDRYNAVGQPGGSVPAPPRACGLTVEGSQVDYDDTSLNANYRREDVYGSYNRTLANSTSNLVLGYSWVELTSFDIERQLAAGRQVTTWRASSRSTVNSPGSTTSSPTRRWTWCRAPTTSADRRSATRPTTC